MSVEGKKHYGRIYKVAGPCKFAIIPFSGRRRENERISNVRACEGRMG